MPASITWDDKSQTVLRYILTGTWTWAEFRLGVDEAVALINSVDHPVDVILDLRNSESLPLDNPFPTLKYMVSVVPPNASQTAFIIVGGQSLMVALVNSLQKIYPTDNKIAFVPTVQAARKIIYAGRAQQRSAQSDSAVV